MLWESYEYLYLKTYPFNRNFKVCKKAISVFKDGIYSKLDISCRWLIS